VRGLAVDDVEVNRELLDEHLKRWGVKLDTAPDARSALAMLRNAAANGEPYQLFMLDRRLPDMDGLELAGLIHGDEAYAQTPMLLLTSMSDNPERSELNRIGIADVLYKPLRQSQLFDALMNMTVDDRSAAYKRREPATGLSADILAQCKTAPPHEAPADGGPLAILVAEDNEVNRMVTEEILRTAGHRYRLVVNGREAVDAAASCRYDLILMDCQMPVMDGFSAVAEIRRREAAGEKFSKHGGLSIIALTANAVRGDRERCLAAGMDGYVAKPIHRGTLYAEIARVLNEARGVPTESASIAPIAASPISESALRSSRPKPAPRPRPSPRRLRSPFRPTPKKSRHPPRRFACRSRPTICSVAAKAIVRSRPGCSTNSAAGSPTTCASSNKRLRRATATAFAAWLTA